MKSDCSFISAVYNGTAQSLHETAHSTTWLALVLLKYMASTFIITHTESGLMFIIGWNHMACRMEYEVEMIIFCLMHFPDDRSGGETA